MRRIRAFLDLPFRVKLMLPEAWLLLGISRLLIRCMNFKTIAPMLGKANKETGCSNEGVDVAKAVEVAKAIAAMSRFTFWESRCLAQACAARMMLKRRNQATTVYLGVAKNDRNELVAHAWLRCGTMYVTGGNGEAKYTVTGTFA